MSQQRNWCFTDFELLDWSKIYEDNCDKVRYVCWGEEISPTTNKVHYQGWIQFKKVKRLGGVKKIIGSKKIHLETCRGNEEQNNKYCKKDNKFQTRGEFKKQGQRTDLDEIKKSIREGASLLEVMEGNFSTYCRHRNGIKDYKKEVDKEKSKAFRKVEVEYIYGTTGTGKTRYGMEQAGFKITGDELKWWDGYEGEKCILIDEYDNNVPVTKLLNILDGYRLRLQVKGSFTYANWNKVIITSNLSPEELHPNAKEKHREALFRRITKTVHLKNLEKFDRT